MRQTTRETALTGRAHFFGDSFTAGQGDPEGLGWVGRLATKCAGIECVNHGVPGAPSRLIADQWLATELDPERAELAIFMLGTNDAVLHVEHNDSLTAVADAIERANEEDVPAFWVGPPPIGDMPAEDAALRELSYSIGGLVRSNGQQFVPTFDALGPGSRWNAEALANDGSHPGAGGYAELATLLEEANLVRWIERNSGAPRGE